MSWVWRKLLQIRSTIRPYFWFNVRNGNLNSISFDNWCGQTPLNQFLIAREINYSGFSLKHSVADLVHNGAWRWLNDWFNRFPELQQGRNSYLVSRRWFPHCIPKHVFHFWLVVNYKLKKQDRLRQWDVGPTTDLNLLRCPFCDIQSDSHTHLFFSVHFLCRFSREFVILEVCLVRLKVLSFRFKKNSIVAHHIIDKLKVPSSFVD
ncbi:reverse transcriptase domain, Reverse transcriptase zinc-binding domain protein [Artemisia annua]|uniref:Reverse transcriptase domain, Reverse transcriptase zinc-binding domain protein n=1 Tax=Artemisia annua TaxID=35608 RepID=A0A2U1PNL4_ARTAN|nr:reverse transcriptase domain, Reverse transcriptase zinc-binding domain protein [Artemisia annua]